MNYIKSLIIDNSTYSIFAVECSYFVFKEIFIDNSLFFYTTPQDISYNTLSIKAFFTIV